MAYFRPSSVAEIEELLTELQALVYESDVETVHRRLRELFPDFATASRAADQRLTEERMMRNL